MLVFKTNVRSLPFDELQAESSMCSSVYYCGAVLPSQLCKCLTEDKGSPHKHYTPSLR